MEFSRICLVLGGVLLIVGIALSFLPKGFEPFSWFGRLPGDISYKSDSATVWIPITSMLIVSIVLSLVARVVHKLTR